MLIIVFLVTAFFVAAIAALIVLLCAGIAREEADKSLGLEPATRTAAMTRRIVGAHGIFRP
jgi:hypothetical protein